MINRLATGEIKQEKKFFIALLLLSIAVAVCIIWQAFGIAYLINSVFIQKIPLSSLKFVLVFTACAIVMRCIMFYLQEATAQKLAEVTKKSIRKKLVTHLIALGPMNHEKHGEIVHLLTDGLDSVESYIARYLPQMGYAIGIPFFMSLAMMYAIPWVGIILFLTYPLIPFFMILIGKKAGKMNEEQWERMSFLSGHFLDVLKGLSTLKIFNKSKEQGVVIGRLAAEFRDSTLRVLRVAFLSALVLELISTISTALIAVYTGVDLLFGYVDFFPAFFILLLAPEFYSPLRELGSAFHTGMAGETALKKCEEFLAIPASEPPQGSHVVTKNLSKIEFVDVSYLYYGRTEPAIKNISFTLSPKKRTMLVGESGAGKSTIAHLLMRLLNPTTGQIIVSEEKSAPVDLLACNGEAWRNQICFVPQKPYLFKGTIRSNIAFGRNVSDDEIEQAAKKAEAHQFIMAHSAGYEREIGEGGMGLSGGEAQRIALARAFLTPASLLILDEVSAHLDVETERLLAKGMERLMEEKIVLLVGHRVETMHWADQILVMRQGEIIQQGSYAVLRNEPGYFRDLLQLGGVVHA